MLPAPFFAYAVNVSSLAKSPAPKAVRQHAGQSGQHARAPLPRLSAALSQRIFDVPHKMKRTKKSRKSPKGKKKPRAVATKTPPSNHSIEVRGSGIHGRGVFATRPIRKGQRIIEYAGRRISWKVAIDMPPTDPKNTNHTKFFGLDDGKVIDPSVGGNESQWINHSCAPNCETDEIRNRIYVVALRNLKKGEELFYDYRLEVEGRRTKKLERDFACYCGAPNCRGTMLEPVE